MTENVVYKKDGHIVTVTLNRPEIRNAISDDDMIGDLVVGDPAHQRRRRRALRHPDRRRHRLLLRRQRQEDARRRRHVRRHALQSAQRLPAGHPAHPAGDVRTGSADHRRRQRAGDRRRLRSDLHVRHPHRRQERQVRRELRQARHHPGRRRRLVPAARGGHVQGARDGLHRRHDRCRRGAAIAAWCRRWSTTTS